MTKPSHPWIFWSIRIYLTIIQFHKWIAWLASKFVFAYRMDSSNCETFIGLYIAARQQNAYYGRRSSWPDNWVCEILGKKPEERVKFGSRGLADRKLLRLFDYSTLFAKVSLVWFVCEFFHEFTFLRSVSCWAVLTQSTIDTVKILIMQSRWTLIHTGCQKQISTVP